MICDSKCTMFLKSWAVPKGIPLEQGAVASAFATEDHPIEYLEFEGIIPEGQYGGGTVMVWDIGTFEIVEGNYWKGRLSVFLDGSKLKGEWMLERSGDENGKTKWLLRKVDDKRRLLSRGEARAISAHKPQHRGNCESGGCCLGKRSAS